jgi:WD40 repeat protein
MSKKDGAVPLKPGPPSSNSYFTSYPIFSAWSDGQGLLITGGGGGGKSYGVLNFLQAHVVIQDPSSRLISVETIATLDTGADAPMALDYISVQGGVWASAGGTSCTLFKFNDDTLLIEPLFKWKSECSGNDLHITNFVKLFSAPSGILVFTGGEDQVARLWEVRQEAGPGTKITQVQLIRELVDHKAEVVDGDWQPSGQHFLTCGKDGTVRIYSAHNQQLVSTIQPRSIDKKLLNENAPLAIRSAYFVGTSDVVVLCHHPRGPAFLMLFSLTNPTAPISAVVISKSITPSMGINEQRDRVVVSHAGGEKDIFAIPSLRKLHASNQHSHEMPPGKTLFVFKDLVVSASPDFSLNFYDPLRKSSGIFTRLLLFIFWLLLAGILIVCGVFMFLPEGKQVLLQHVPALKQFDPHGAEL